MKELLFRRFGTMLDCSRNGVMTVDALKKWIGLLSDFGYNTLLLYTEDTYTLPGRPYFGYGRGRYTEEELRAVDAFAAARGIEVIPCIQTLAHLKTLLRWPEYCKMTDLEDILLVDEEPVYALIEDMFRTLARCYRSRTVNIGMDEAMLVGRGKYAEKHGFADGTQLVLSHLKRVAAIGEKYGFSLCMWSDMFWRLASGGDYNNADAVIRAEVQEQLPANVHLIYWDYFHDNKEHYDKMLDSHQKIDPGVWFAGGLWTWLGFAPHNTFSIESTALSLESCRERGVENVFFTLWGDNGAECSRFSLLPALLFAAEFAHGNRDMENIRRRFQQKIGIAFEDFMLLDLRLGPNCREDCVNPDKYLLYNDPFLGLVDSTLKGGENEGFARCAAALDPLTAQPEYGYLFETLAALCRVLAVKAELGAHTRAAYASRAPEALQAVIGEYEQVLERLPAFYAAFRRQWERENKGFGFEVQDIRLGGLTRRLEHCADRLRRLAAGELEKIDELEEPVLDYEGGADCFARRQLQFNNWAETVTPNLL